MIDRKDIFMSGFKSKIGYSFTYKDLNEFEAIIDFYEQQCKKQKEVIDKLEKKIKVVKQYDFDKVGRYELLDILNEASE